MTNLLVKRLVNIGLILAFSVCYMEWGGGNTAFIAMVEYELLFGNKSLLQSITHPLILTGLTGQLILLYGILSPTSSRILNILGIALLSIMVLLVLLAGILSLNANMIVSVMPFIGLALFYIFRMK